MIHGWEDYDLWLSFLEIGLGVHCISEILFYYRQHPKSMSKEHTVNRHRELFVRIYERHRDLYQNNMAALLRLSFNLVGANFGLKEEVAHLGRRLSSSDLGRKEDVARLEQNILGYKEEVARLEQKISSSDLEHKEEVARLEQKFSRSDLEHKEEVARLGQKILSSDLGHKEDVARLGQKILSSDLGHKEDVVRLEQNILGYKEEVARLERKISDLENKRYLMRRSLSWRVTSPLRCLGHLFSWKDGVISNVKTEMRVFIWRILVRLPFTRQANALRRQVQQMANSGLFDSLWYCVEYEPMPAVNGHPILHYLLIGAKRGCNPNPLFATSWYLREHPEVAAGGMNPLLHYAEIGAKSHFDPNPNFDARRYMAENPGVDWGEVNPLQHYFVRGARNPAAHAPMGS
jgi:phage shock protein A